MTLASQYNVDSGLLGLGELILMQIINEIQSIKDVVQVIGVCKKTFILKDHERFFKVMVYKTDPIQYQFIIPEVTAGKQQGNQFIHSHKDIDNCSILFDPIVKEGIVRFEVIFENNEGFRKYIGIADQSCSFAVDDRPWDSGSKFFVYYIHI
ncbi:MAG: hypothetical protein EZS28_010109 [Streblomastix strix]|uniref:Uncharacterized protein n=1 Tax=Streblomastix strix TaxID=222440 RepID=A0A5J4WI61_9EUKA|nr:MAG: hypothetical protein EZS28_010109 [Streblomastix strix]